MSCGPGGGADAPMPDACFRRRRPALTVVLLAALLGGGAGPAFAQKTDVIKMANGDRVTCEIKRLDRGILTAKTDSWGTIDIEWPEVAFVESPVRFDIQLQSGERLTGSLGRGGANGRVVIDGREVAILSAITITPLRESYWAQLDGGLDVGYSYASAGDSNQWSLSGDVRHHREATDFRLSADSLFSSKSGAEDTSRHALGAEWTRYVATNWGVAILGQAQRNEELSLKFRAQVGAGVVHRLVQSNSTLFAAFAGGLFNREVFTDDTPSTDSWELILGTQFQYFLFNTPKTRVTIALSLFPNLSTRGRVRSELNASLRREIVKDLTVSLSVLDSYDSDPPSADARRHDLAVVTSVGWTF
jgi:Protein of unknown function, DUF481